MKRDNVTDGHRHEDSTVTMQSLPQKLKIFKAEVKSEVKKELTCISYAMKRKFGEIQETIQEEIAKLNKMQCWVTELGKWHKEANEALVMLLSHAQQMQEKITNLEQDREEATSTYLAYQKKQPIPK